MDQRRGYLSGFAAYVLWGFFPIYFHYLRPAGPGEILAHRIIWSALCVTLITTAIHRWPAVRAMVARPRTLVGITIAAVLIAVNWFTYIYGVNSDRVIETALGYFINPLISVLFGVFVFRERLRPTQLSALAIGGIAVAIITIDYGRLPWIALTLAVSFASYGLVKKWLGLPPTDGLLVESSVLALPALGYLAYLTARGESTFTSAGSWHTVMLVLAGVITAIPLLLFADAANRVPMTGIGILQYIAPVLQLACGVFVFNEPMRPSLLAGFVLVWIALAVFTWDALRHARHARIAGRTATAARHEAPTSPAGVAIDQL